MNLAIIPARGGSKSIKNKNLVLLARKPLISYSIQTALACSEIDRVIVSTDSQQIAEIAQKFGAEVPFLRPKNLAKDDTSMVPVLIHAMKFFENKSHLRTKFVILLDPTSPFRTCEDIKNCLKVAKEEATESVVTVCEAEHNPYFVMGQVKNGYFVPLIKSKREIKYRQQAPKVYRVNAAVYVIKRDVLLTGKIFTKKTRPYIMPQERSIHIDEPLDLVIAEFLLTEGYVKL